MYKLCTVKG